MGFYRKIIFPFLMEQTMNVGICSKQRNALLEGVGGEILEIGFGTGLNLPHYPEGVEKITTIDINPGMSKRAKKRIAQFSIKVDFRILDGAKLPMEDNSFDSVVSTWTLCSIADVGSALGEIRRVLKPGGRFYFVEHGLSDDPKVQRWQNRITPFWKKIGDGCHLNRNIKEIVAEHDFKFLELRQFYLEKTAKFFGYTYWGIAE